MFYSRTAPHLVMKYIDAQLIEKMIFAASNFGFVNPLLFLKKLAYNWIKFDHLKIMFNH